VDVVWVEETVVLAIHDAQLAEHGGAAGVRDRGLLQSALARPINAAAYGMPDLAALAAAYAQGIARNHPFIDGNKRTAYVVMELFLARNGVEMVASDEAAVLTMLQLAEGSMPEAAYADWIRANSQPLD
jgi:death on curing protein